jgi:hypothetical protein
MRAHVNRFHLPLLVAVIALAGCASPVPTGGTPPTGVDTAGMPTQPQAGGAPAANPAAPGAAVATAANLTGRATLPGGAFADAAITVMKLGDTTVLATATSDAGGGFALAVPADVPAGALLKVVATKDGRTLAAITTAPAARQVQQNKGQDKEVKVNTPSTLALLLLNARLDAAGKASQDAKGKVQDKLVEATMQAFTALAAASEQTLRQSSSATSEAVTTALTPGGTGTLNKDLNAQLGASQALVNQFQQIAGNLGTAIADGIKAGGQAPPAELLGALTLGNATSAQVAQNTPGSGGSGGSGGGTPVEPTVDVGGSVVITPGTVATDGSEAITIEPIATDVVI